MRPVPASPGSVLKSEFHSRRRRSVTNGSRPPAGLPNAIFIDPCFSHNKTNRQPLWSSPSYQSPLTPSPSALPRRVSSAPGLAERTRSSLIFKSPSSFQEQARRRRRREFLDPGNDVARRPPRVDAPPRFVIPGINCESSWNVQHDHTMNGRESRCSRTSTRTAPAQLTASSYHSTQSDHNSHLRSAGELLGLIVEDRRKKKKSKRKKKKKSKEPSRKLHRQSSLLDLCDDSVYKDKSKRKKQKKQKKKKKAKSVAAVEDKQKEKRKKRDKSNLKQTELKQIESGYSDSSSQYHSGWSSNDETRFPLGSFFDRQAKLIRSLGSKVLQQIDDEMDSLKSELMPSPRRSGSLLSSVEAGWEEEEGDEGPE